MPFKKKPLREIFTHLNQEENRPISEGLPRFGGVNDAVDMEYLRYKLRLYTRYLSYAAALRPENVELKEENFTEMLALLARRPELLGMDPVCGTYWRVAQLQQTDYAAARKRDVDAVLEYVEIYAAHFSTEERVEVMHLIVNFCIRVGSTAQPDFLLESKLLVLRSVVVEFGPGGQTGSNKYLNENVLQSVTIVLNRSVKLEALHFFKSDTTGAAITNRTEWVEAFIRCYSRFLAPDLRKPYQRFLRMVVHIHREEYYEGLKVGRDLKVKNNMSVNISIKRMLFMCVFSLRHYGTIRERKQVRKAGITAEALLERMRKQLDYLAKTRPVNAKIVAQNRLITEAMRKLLRLYKLRENAPLAATTAAEHEDLRAWMKGAILWSSPLTKQWCDEQMKRLEG